MHPCWVRNIPLLSIKPSVQLLVSGFLTSWVYQTFSWSYDVGILTREAILRGIAFNHKCKLYIYLKKTAYTLKTVWVVVDSNAVNGPVSSHCLREVTWETNAKHTGYRSSFSMILHWNIYDKCMKHNTLLKMNWGFPIPFGVLTPYK